MTRDEFFESIKADCVSEVDFIIELMRVRGCLIDETPQEYYLSDNGHVLDEKYLNEIFRRYKLGCVENGKIVVLENTRSNQLLNEFSEKNRVSYPSCWDIWKGWNCFKRREHGEKVPVSCLEPFIARYIKAISACCVLTAGSCDGNHHRSRKMFIIMDGEESICWHRLICEKCLVDKFDICWDENFTAMHFTQKTRYDTYHEVNKAAEYLYRNRKVIRRIKTDAFSGMSRLYLKKRPSEEIKDIFVEKANKLFDENISSFV